MRKNKWLTTSSCTTPLTRHGITGALSSKKIQYAVIFAMIKFPSEEDIRTLYSYFPFENLKIQDSDFAMKHTNSIEGVKQLATIQELSAWKIALHNKWNDIAYAYVMMMFYYNQGIPDEPYYISPGKKEQSVEYFPNFNQEHYLIKDSFDFYADVYFFKFFSAINDGVWQILNVYFNLGIDVYKVTWKNIRFKIANIDSKILDSLEKIYKDDRYIKGNNLRNSITHRLPVGSQGTGIRRKDNAIIFRVLDYVSARETVEVAKGLLDFGIEAFEKIKKLCN